jgi:uncharacterized protein (DUF1330 family)
MPAYLSFTCNRAEAQRLRELLDQLAPLFARQRGRLLPAQGPQTGFYDPDFGALVVMRLVRFPKRVHVDAVLNDPAYKASAIRRGRFTRLDVAVVDRD